MAGRMREKPVWALWAEFVVLFVAVPVAIAVVLPATAMFPALFAMTAVGLVLLHLTEGFSWRDLGAERGALEPWLIAKFAVAVFVLSLAVLWATAPDAMFVLLREQPVLMLAIAVLYPLVSALPQEIVFRPLFFRRYVGILPRGRRIMLANAAIFSLAHLMYWSWIVAAMTFAGGLVFAWAYEEKRSFPLAFALHSVAGVALFTAGMGVYFYSGNVVRPF